MKRVAGYVSGGTPVAWSPDGTSIAFTSGTALWLMRADGSGRRKVHGDPNRQTRSPAWSPDGTKIAWEHGDGDLEIYVANRDGTGVRNLTDNEVVQDSLPTWTPDGRSLVFRRTCWSWRSSRSAHLVVNADGGEPSKLPALPRLHPSSSDPVWKP